MHAAAHLPGDEQARNVAGCVGPQLHTAVLIVQRGVDQHWLLGDVNVEACELPHHRWQVFLDGTSALDDLDHGRIQPQGGLPGGGDDAIAALLALADEGRRLHVSGLQGIDELLAELVDRLGSQAAHLLSDQQTDDLFRESRASGVVLHGFQVAQRRANAIGHHHAVGRRAVVVGGGKALVVQPPASTGRHHHRLGLDVPVSPGLHVHHHRAGDLSLVVQHQFDGGGELDHGDALLPVAHLVA